MSSTIASAGAPPFAIGESGRQWAEVVLDPLDQDKHVLSPGNVAYIPDGTGIPRWLLKTSGQITWLGSTATAGIMQLPGLRSQHGDDYTWYDLNVTYGGNPMSGETMTTRLGYHCREHTVIDTLYNNLTDIRPVSCAININTAASDTNSQGTLNAYMSEVPLYYTDAGTTATVHYNTTPAILSNRVTDKTYLVTHAPGGGLTLRMRVTPHSLLFEALPGKADETAASRLHGDRPTVVFYGIGAAAALTVTWNTLWEVKVTEPIPFASGNTACEPAFPALVAWANEQSLHASGHSFLGTIGKLVGSGLSKVRNLVTGAASSITGVPKSTLNALNPIGAVQDALTKQRPRAAPAGDTHSASLEEIRDAEENAIAEDAMRGGAEPPAVIMARFQRTGRLTQAPQTQRRRRAPQNARPQRAQPRGQRRRGVQSGRAASGRSRRGRRGIPWM